MREVLQLARRIAPHNMPILLVGETGTGKELLAQEIHRWSGRRGRIMDINCGSLPQGMVEGLLFGHRKGSFTGAMQAVTGLIEAAAGGTLFLDELSSLPPEAQVKLLRVLDTGLVRPLGGTRDRQVDFSLVAAAQEDIWVRLDAGHFRQDLYQRVAGMVLTLPPLCERPDDIMVLAEWFAEELGIGLGSGVEGILINYSWPGNVRELKHAIERAGFLTKGSDVSSENLSLAIELGAPRGMSSRRNHLSGERNRLIDACTKNEWHAARTARFLGISRNTLFKRLKRVGLSLRQPIDRFDSTT